MSMPMKPDGIEVVATVDDAHRLPLPPLLIVDEVQQYLDREGLGRGPIEWSRIGDGQSNITYRIRRGDDQFVLRRGPRPPHPRSAHDMVREARIQALLGGAGVPVPRILAICEDESVLGVPFYVMEYLDGVVITDQLPRGLDDDADRPAIAFAAIDSLIALHRVDVSSGPLAEFGRRDGYLRRQVTRFGSLWEQNSRRGLADVALIGRWLSDHLPESQAVTVVHGDYRIGNLMFSAGRPARVSAILDWEMATLGDPLADLGYLTATYSVPGGIATPMDLTTVTREPGFPSRAHLVERYQKSMKLDLSDLGWYQALALWKAAIFCEAMYTRWLDGERPGDTTFAPTLGLGIPALLEAAKSVGGIPDHH
ncbi:MAG: phosphotransferase family protein [Actinomycetota bacterium]